MLKMKDKNMETTETTGKGRWKKFKSIFTGIFCVIVLIAIISTILDRTTNSELVKNGKLVDYPEKTIEAAFETAFGYDGEWVEYEEFGSDMVAYNVECKGHFVKVIFIIRDDKEYFNTYQLYLDGEEYTYYMEEFLDSVYKNPLVFRDSDLY